MDSSVASRKSVGRFSGARRPDRKARGGRLNTTFFRVIRSVSIAGVLAVASVCLMAQAAPKPPSSFTDYVVGWIAADGPH